MDSPASAASPQDAPPPRPARLGPAVIKDYVSRLPGKPGVYRMLDRAGDVLYVGKARNLKNRVGNYVRLGGHTNRIAAMIAQTAAMEFTVTDTETEALLLEANLIKRLKPKYNIILRDDKSFPYILIRRDHAAPQLVKHRGARATKGEYFGPFASAGAVTRTLNTLQKAFLIRTCSDSVYDNRTRPCMLHQIKRCAAPCVGLVSEDAYAALVEDARAFLTGKSDALRARLHAEMETAAQALDFEAAAKLRDRIRALAPITTAQGVNPDGVEEADVIALAMAGGQSCVHAAFYRSGQHWGDRAVFPRHEKDASAQDILSAFLGQFYDDKPAPKLILLAEPLDDAALIEEALSLRAGRKIEIKTPQRGEKAQLAALARRNAEEALARRLAESSAQTKLLEAVKDVFDLDAPPERIEVYDNSHIQGSNAVGAMIVAGGEGFDKRAYRTFNIKTAELTPGDDYAMMREVLRRRFARLLKERDAAAADEGDADVSPAQGEKELGETSDGAVSPPVCEGDGPPDVGEEQAPAATPSGAVPPRPAAWPDLVLIDGGRGQLSAALETLAELGLGPDDVALVAIAKGEERNAGRETFFMPGRSPFKLEPSAPALHYLQRLRDEAHRFAIGTHRAKRARDIAKNPLDDIPGVGPGRKKALLAHFGSARSVTRANLSDLERVDGVSKQLAKRIYDWFRD